MTIARLQTSNVSFITHVESWLESERDQVGLWLPVALGSGIAAWFVLPLQESWIAVILAGCAIACCGLSIGMVRRSGYCLFVGGLAVAAGCALIWWRAETLTAPKLTQPVVTTFEATVTRVEAQPARAQSRIWLKTGPAHASSLPPLVRVTVKETEMVAGLASGDRVRLRARLVPPPEAPVPGSYDFSRTAWFLGLGATGSAIGPLLRLSVPQANGNGIRARLASHVRSQLEGSAGGIAAAFASGDRGGIAPEDEDAMRNSGLTHLLSISGLHITAVVAAAMFLALRLLSLSPTLALRWPLPLIAAGVGAAAGVSYTALTGAEVPTIRSCIAALLVLVGIAMGREAMTLRLVAAGALVILLIWPESLVGASFQLSFAAITVIVALHDDRHVRQLTMRRDERLWRRLSRGLASLLLTGVAVELALAPIAMFHFHKSGVYGALANIVAIPLTTFVTMPLEALALLFDLVGLGWPFWFLTGLSLDFLLWLARTTAAAPGAVAVVSEIPLAAYALIVAGGLWFLLWKHKARLFGLMAIAAGGVAVNFTVPPDLLVTGDGRHLVVADAMGTPLVLRPRAGDYIRDVLAERMGTLSELADIDMSGSARCGPDLCRLIVHDGHREWRIAATRSDYRLPWRNFIETCRSVDIIISSRMLPEGCKVRWLRADRSLLQTTGGLAITLRHKRIVTVRQSHDDHPWRKSDAAASIAP
jgi:competence protein ComEC